MPFHNGDVKEICNELNLILRDTKLNKIYQHTDDIYIINFYRNNEYNLLVNLTNQYARTCLTKSKYKAKQISDNLCLYVRKHLLGKRLIKIEQIDNDRIIKLQWMNDLDEYLSLYIEHVPKSNNIFLVNQNGKTIFSSKKSKTRKIGDEYTLPEKKSNISELKYTINKDDITDEKLYNFLLDNHFKNKERYEKRNKIINSVKQFLKKELKSKIKLKNNIENDLKKCSTYKELERNGNLIKANIYQIKKGMKEITLKDWETNEDIIVKLDILKNPTENMQDMFKKAKKYKNGFSVLKPKIDTIELDIKKLESWNAEIEKAEDESEILSIFDKETDSKFINKYVKKIKKLIKDEQKRVIPTKKKESHEYRYFLSENEMKIYVGRSNKENERLTLKFARGNDAWFHIRNYAGSHVVVPIPKNKEIDQETILDAANLAIYFSKAKDNLENEVVYTKRKYLRKISGSPAGQISMSKHKVLSIRYDDNRIKRLIETKNFD